MNESDETEYNEKHQREKSTISTILKSLHHSCGVGKSTQDLAKLIQLIKVMSQATYKLRNAKT